MLDWAYQWKMSYKPDRVKLVQEVIFSRIPNKIIHPACYFNNVPVNLGHAQNHLGLQPDGKLSFNKHANNKSVM